jgi:predicted hotdog family 3-hydroxylacyl-ACP dehydratase
MTGFLKRRQKNSMPLSDLNVRELLPQQDKFVMVDRLQYVDKNIVVTSMTVKNENIFVEDGIFTATGIIENIAQTAVARIGYIKKYIDKTEVKLGVIGEIKNFVIERCPRVGDVLTTTVGVDNEIFSTLLIQAKVNVNDELIAHGNMKISMVDF